MGSEVKGHGWGGVKTVGWGRYGLSFIYETPGLGSWLLGATWGLLARPKGLEASLWVRGLWVCVWVGQGGKEVVTSTGGTTVGPHLPCLSFTISVCSQTVCACVTVCVMDKDWKKKEKNTRWSREKQAMLWWSNTKFRSEFFRGI